MYKARIYLIKNNKEVGKKKKHFKIEFKAYIEYLINYVTFNLYKI